MMTDSAHTLVLDQVQVSRGGRQLFSPISMECPSGTVLGVIGPNGSGKSSLLSAIAGTGASSSGDISFDGESLTHIPARRRAGIVAFATQDSQAPNELLVRDIVQIGAVARQRAQHTKTRRHAESHAGKRAESRAGQFSGQDSGLRFAHTAVHAPEQRTQAPSITEAMDAMGVGDLAERHYSTLSGGQRQLVQMARVVAQNTPVLLLDEPTSALDPAHQLAVMSMLTAQAQSGAIVLVTLHDLSAALHSCDQLLLLTGRGAALAGSSSTSDGSCSAMVGTPSEILRPEIIHQVYGVDTEILTSAKSGRHYINLLSQSASSQPATKEKNE